MKATHKAAALRKTGITARINYGVAIILIFIYGLFISRTLWNKLPKLEVNGYTFTGRRYGIWDALLHNNGELLFLIILMSISIILLSWLLFASKLAVIRLRLFKNVKYFIPVFSVLYLYCFFGVFWKNLPETQALAFGIAVFAIVALHFTGVYFAIKKPEKHLNTTIYNINAVNVFMLFVVVQYLHPSAYFWYIFWMLFVPVIILYFKNSILIVVEYVKESELYRRLFIRSVHGESSRWASYYTFFKNDIGTWFIKNRNRIWFSAESTLFLGKTFFENDFQLTGRNIGFKTEWHMITVAGTRGGKSVDVIYTNVLNYAGGVIALDVKGEITQVVWKRRSQQRPFYVLDPFNVVIEKKGSGVALKNSHWNILDEIDVNHPEAREHIITLAEACIEKSENEAGNAAHFRETAQIVLRGVIAYVLSDPFLEDEQRHLGTVFNFIKYGAATASQFCPIALNDFIKFKLTTNHAVGGAAKETASILTTVGDKEKGAILSTLTRGIDWMNSPSIQKIICHKSDFSLADAKAKEASIFLILPEEHLQKFNRLTSAFYTMGLNKCSNHVTPQPKGSKRRVLFLMEEFSKLGYFAPVAQKITIAAGSYIKFWFILQSIDQIRKVYKNEGDFWSSCDLQVFALDKKDHDSAKYISDVLGNYTVKNKKNGSEQTYKLMEASEVSEFLDVGTKNQIIIPREGYPLKLRRVPFFKLFKRSQYGKNTR